MLFAWKNVSVSCRFVVKVHRLYPENPGSCVCPSARHTTCKESLLCAFVRADDTYRRCYRSFQHGLLNRTANSETMPVILFILSIMPIAQILIKWTSRIHWQMSRSIGLDFRDKGMHVESQRIPMCEKRNEIYILVIYDFIFIDQILCEFTC